DILAQIDIVVFASASGKGHKNGDSTAKQRNFRIYREFRTRHADSGHLAAFSLSGSACNFKINAFTLLQYISISVKVNIAEIVLILHKPYAGKIGNRLTNQSAEFASYKKVGNKIPYFRSVATLNLYKAKFGNKPDYPSTTGDFEANSLFYLNKFKI